MNELHLLSRPEGNIHNWLHKVNLCFVPGQNTPLLERFIDDLLAVFHQMGNTIQPAPDEHTDLILTTAPFGKSIPWREALLFTGRRRFKLDHVPTVITLMHARPAEFQEWMDYFGTALRKEPIDPADFSFPDLASTAHRTLIEQGLRGGPILSLERLLQSQSKSIRILLIVGEDRPREVYHFDLVGAYPRSEAAQAGSFFQDVVLRILTALSTQEVTQHQVVGEPLPASTWNRLTSPADLRIAGQELGRRGFFTEMVRIADLVHVPALDAAIASQYSEGCFATWEPQIGALLATITGSARPVDKQDITQDELAVIVGVRPDGKGALVRSVEGKRNDPPSSEAVEMFALDRRLPRITLDLSDHGQVLKRQVPVARSKLHGHRGVSSFHPGLVEFVPLDPAYYAYPVSCATEAQAQGIEQAFAGAEALNHPADPRLVVFTVLPGHGVVMVEKWKAGKAPFQVIWEFMDQGILTIDSRVPQGALSYKPRPADPDHCWLFEPGG